MDMPEVTSCLGMFPPKYACFLISVFGIGSGGVGLTGIVLYGIMEDSVISYFTNTTKLDPGLKKATLVTIGLSSLLLFIGNILLFLGVIFHTQPAVDTFVWIMLILCSILVIATIAAPMSCFFLPGACLIKKVSTALSVILYLIIMAFLDIWLYFMVVAYNFSNSM